MVNVAGSTGVERSERKRLLYFTRPERAFILSMAESFAKYQSFWRGPFQPHRNTGKALRQYNGGVAGRGFAAVFAVASGGLPVGLEFKVQRVLI